MKVAILGGTAGMGRALARLMASRGDRVFLLGHEAEDLERSARDLEIRAGQGRVGTAHCDMEQPETFAPALDRASAAMDGLDCVVLTAALFASQERLEADRALMQRMLTMNFVHSVDFCELARKKLLSGGGGSLVVFSSVAGDRGRKPVILYGAAKSGLSTYLEALDHRYRADGLHTLCVKPGFVRTAMTAGLKPPPFAGDPEPVAQRVLAAIDQRRPVVYAPAMWRWVMLVIRNLPRFIMRRVGF